VAVEDPVLMEKIRRTQRILGKDIVSGDDIEALDRDGAFADLGPEQGAKYERVAWPAPRRM
jgi:hypothetical protein